MTDHEREPEWTLALRRGPARPGSIQPDNGTIMFEIICRMCGDDPDVDYRKAAADLRQIRGPHSLPAGFEAFLEHEKFHGTGEEARPPRPAQVSAHR